MSIILLIESFDNEEEISYTKQLETKNFCSKECAEEYLFDTYELEGCTLNNDEVINISECSITIVESEDDLVCEYFCD